MAQDDSLQDIRQIGGWKLALRHVKSHPIPVFYWNTFNTATTWFDTLPVADLTQKIIYNRPHSPMRPPMRKNPIWHSSAITPKTISLRLLRVSSTTPAMFAPEQQQKRYATVQSTGSKTEPSPLDRIKISLTSSRAQKHHSATPHNAKRFPMHGSVFFAFAVAR